MARTGKPWRRRASKEKRQPSKPRELVMRSEPNIVVAKPTSSCGSCGALLCGRNGWHRRSERAIHIAKREEANRELQGLVESPPASAIPSDSSNDAPTPRLCVARERGEEKAGRDANTNTTGGCPVGFPESYLLNVLVYVLQLTS